MIQYFKDYDTEGRIEELVEILGFKHIDLGRVICVRSSGSKSRNILARVHTLPRLIQQALGIRAHYFIEIISENFDKLSEEEKTKTLIHELLHIPKTFGGGFRHHRDHVNKRTVERAYNIYIQNCNKR